MSETLEPSPWAAELAELLREATPGPWRPDDESWAEMNDISIYSGPHDEPNCVANMGSPIERYDDHARGEQSHTNARLICLLRNHGDEILAAVTARSTP